ncbi:MAG: hypothetical protein FJY56_17740 [Betaproteobacteria bacterium]|nr:hypothetical protein [Betaproteobacteria bacterium]
MSNLMLDRLQAARPNMQAPRNLMCAAFCGALKHLARARGPLLALTIAATTGCTLPHGAPPPSARLAPVNAERAIEDASEAGMLAAHYHALAGFIEADMLALAVRSGLYPAHAH